MATTKPEPYERILSDNVKIYFGYKDAHAVVKAKTPVGIWYTVQIPADTIRKFKSNFDDAYKYGQLPEESRTIRNLLNLKPGTIAVDDGDIGTLMWSWGFVISCGSGSSSRLTSLFWLRRQWMKLIRGLNYLNT